MNQFAGGRFSSDYDSGMPSINARDRIDSTDEGAHNTIEMELSTAEVRALSCPAVDGPSPTPPAPTPAPSASSALAPAHRRVPRVGGIVGIAIIAAALGGAAYFSANRRAPAAPVLAKETTSIATPTATPEPQVQGPPVTFKNPFDASEVFEFPPGTTQLEARQKVAELLSQRALERQSLLVPVRHRRNP